MDLQARQPQKQITQLQPSNLQIVKENITQEDVESPVLPLAMTTSHTKNAQVLAFDEILKDASPLHIPSLKLLKSPREDSPIADDLNKLELLDSSRSDFQIQEQQTQPNNFKNIAQILAGSTPRGVSKTRSLSGAIRARTNSHCLCPSSKSNKKFFHDRKANTNEKYTKSDRSTLLGIKRAPSDLIINLDNNQVGGYIELDLLSSQKRKKLDDDTTLLKGFKPTNKAMIKAIDSDDALDYLRVRKQKGESKITIKKANVFEKVSSYKIAQDEEEVQNLNIQMQITPFQQKQELISDNSSIMGDRWYDKKDAVDFKFEVTSAVDSIEFPMNQNLNLKLNLKSLDGELNQNQQKEQIDAESPNCLSKQPFQFTGEKVDLNLQIQNDKQEQMPVKSDMKPLRIQKFNLSNLKPFDQLLDESSVDNDDLQ